MLKECARELLEGAFLIMYFTAVFYFPEPYVMKLLLGVILSFAVETSPRELSMRRCGILLVREDLMYFFSLDLDFLLLIFSSVLDLSSFVFFWNFTLIPLFGKLDFNL